MASREMHYIESRDMYFPTHKTLHILGYLQHFPVHNQGLKACHNFLTQQHVLVPGNILGYC